MSKHSWAGNISTGWGQKGLNSCSVVQSPLFIWKQILHFNWKSRSQSLEERVEIPRCLFFNLPQAVIVWGAMSKSLNLMTEINQLYDIFSDFQLCVVIYWQSIRKFAAENKYWIIAYNNNLIYLTAGASKALFGLNDKPKWHVVSFFIWKCGAFPNGFYYAVIKITFYDQVNQKSGSEKCVSCVCGLLHG